MYCQGEENPKYSNKYKELKERALYEKEDWHDIRDQLIA